MVEQANEGVKNLYDSTQTHSQNEAGRRNALLISGDPNQGAQIAEMMQKMQEEAKARGDVDGHDSESSQSEGEDQ